MHNASTALCNQHPRNPHHHQQHPPPRGGGEQGQIRAPVSRLNPPPCPCSLTTPTPPSPGISTRGTPPHQPVPAASFLPTRGTRCARLLISPRRSLTYTLQRPSSALHSPSYPGVNQKLTHPRNPCRLHPLHLRALTFTLHHTPQHQGRAPERNVVSSSHPPLQIPRHPRNPHHQPAPDASFLSYPRVDCRTLTPRIAAKPPHLLQLLLPSLLPGGKPRRPRARPPPYRGEFITPTCNPPPPVAPLPGLRPSTRSYANYRLRSPPLCRG